MKSADDAVLAGATAVQRGSSPSFAGSMRPEVLAVISVGFGAVGQLIVKAALLFWNRVSVGPVADHGLLLEAFAGVLLGLLVYAGGTWFWVKAVARASISSLYPISACSYVVVAIGARFLFKEDIQPQRWAGIAVITLGVAMLSISNLRGSE
jgi:drug/metabolite transporter (DMT)-like permease